MRQFCYVLAAVGLVGFLIAPPQAKAQNYGPPAGAILDLAGDTMTSTYTQYTVNFTATLTSTDITFLFRNDPGFIAATDFSVVNDTTSGSNQFVDPSFQGGTIGGLPIGWNYDPDYTASTPLSYTGLVQSTGTPGNCGYAPGTLPGGGSNLWCDGTVQGYDAIDQMVSTVVGDTYTISFYQADTPSGGAYQDVSTNGDVSDIGGNGIDTLVYVGSTIPNPTVPEPGSVLLLGTCLLAIPLIRRKFQI